jgi:hypothetical protein
MILGADVVFAVPRNRIACLHGRQDWIASANGDR